MNKAYYFVPLLFLILFSSTVFGYERIPDDKIVFAASMDDAKREAKERNCPIFVFIHEGN